MIDYRSSHSQRRGNRHHASLIGLACRVLPVLVLCLGAWLLLGGSRVADAQVPRTNQPYNYNQPNRFSSSSYNNGQGFGASQPSARVATAPTSTSTSGFAIPPAPATDALAGETEAVEAGGLMNWEMPGFVKKIAEGGWLMLPLAFCSLVVIGLSLERMIALRRSRVIPKPFVRRFTECVEDGQLSYDEATSICDDFDCPVAEVFHAAVRRWGRPMMEIEQAVIDAGDRVGDSLRRFLRVFHAISNVTPLIGLLGTVLGMIQAFEMLSSPEAAAAAGGQSDLLAAGISTALMTTAGGLTVAIPAYLAYMYFGAKSDRYLGEIDKLCQRVIDCISAEGLENSGNTKTTRKRRAA